MDRGSRAGLAPRRIPLPGRRPLGLAGHPSGPALPPPGSAGPERARRHPQLAFVEDTWASPVSRAPPSAHPSATPASCGRSCAGAAAGRAETTILCDKLGRAAPGERVAVRGKCRADATLVVGRISGGFRLADSIPPVKVLPTTIFRRSREAEAPEAVYAERPRWKASRNSRRATTSCTWSTASAASAGWSV